MHETEKNGRERESLIRYSQHHGLRSASMLSKTRIFQERLRKRFKDVYAMEEYLKYSEDQTTLEIDRLEEASLER